MLTITPAAARQIKAVLAGQNMPGGFLRLKVMAGGCSGMRYEFQFTDKRALGDAVAEHDGAKVAVDARTLNFVKGAVVDYKESLMASGFELKNPNASGSCSCGASFSV
ncbi:MAG: iron-sulfur cluster assembly accessory protein [Elusimicrobia bacterium]|nr:iron-sulfur cluster assembly accessory protein [Elusimicrobiota bacterium]